MPQLIEVPDQGIVEFPDDMSDDDIAVAIQSNFPRGATAASADSSPAGAGSIPAPATPDDVVRETARIQELAFGPVSPLGATIAANRALSPEPPVEPVAGAVAGAVPQPINQEAAWEDRQDRAAQAVKETGNLDAYADEMEKIKAERQAALVAAGRGGFRDPLMPLPKPDGTGVGAGIARGLISTVEGIETPENIALMGTLAGAPAAISRLTSAFFGGLMAKGAVEQIDAAIDAEAPGDKAEALTSAILSGGIAALAGKHAVGESRGAATVRERAETSATETARQFTRESVDRELNELLATPVEDLLKAPVREAESATAPATPAPEAPAAATVSPESRADVARPAAEPKTGAVKTAEITRQQAESPDAAAIESIRTEYGVDTETAVTMLAEARNRFANEPTTATQEIAAPERTPAAELAPPVAEKPSGWSDERWEIFQRQRAGALEMEAQREADFQRRQAILNRGKSEGPGAAAETEPLVSYEKRRFGERFQEDQTIDPAIREATGNQYYEPIPNLATVREAEAIIERRGTDESVRLVRDESFPMDHRVRSTMAQGLIKKLNQSYSEATKAGDTKAAEGFLNQAVDTAEYLSELGTKLGQGVQSFAIWSRLTPEGMLMAAKRTIRKARAKQGPEGEIPKDLDPEELAELTRMAAEIENTPEGFQRNEKMTEFLGRIADMKGVDPADIPTALWYANILSGYSTQLVNTVDTGLNVFSEAASMAASHPSAVPDIISGLYRGMLKGGLEAKEALKTGRGRTENKLQIYPVLERARFGEAGGVPVSTETAFGRVLKAGLEKKPAKILNLWKYPLRAMVASDTVFYNSFKEARSRVLARVMAKKEGLSGNALFQRVDEILNQTPEKIAAAEQQAQAEGLTGARYKRRVREIQEQGRPEELVSNADEAAQIATYNHDPTGTLGVIAGKISEITQHVPLARAIVPFTRIVANVANRGLDYTPWGYKRLFFGQHGGERFATKPPVGEAYRAQLVKATAGTLGMTALAALDAADIVQVTASGPQNPDERKQLQNSGWKPYSVKVGDTWVSYQYTPLNLGLAMVGHYRDAIRYNKLDEKDAQTRLAYGMLKAGSTLFDMSFLSGLSGFMETVSGSTSSSKAAGRMLARTGSSVVIPNLFKQIDRLFDPTLYDAPTVQQMLIRETPVARSLALEPMLNVLGEPIQLSNNRFFSFDKDDPVWKLIIEKQAFVPVPSKTRKVGKRPITPKEYRELIEASGKEIRSYIANNLDTLQAVTPEEAQRRVNEAATKSRDSVMKRFSEANPRN